MSNWKDSLRDKLGLRLPVSVKFLIDIAHLYGPIWAVLMTAMVAIIFHFMEWNFFAVSIGRRVAIEMLTTPLKHTS